MWAGSVVHDTIESFLRTNDVLPSPEDQEALVDKRFAAKTPDERKRILDALREASRALPRRPLLEEAEAPPAPEPPGD